ncbi:YbaN family protein [Caulobacter hibisci]|uniref:YbaN family protein n=1 Tax=Caulobacter hibisci TaxID=2035993 RepID=A0ABS0SU86_9CAUL|nr:YbaN family protein [Caulobacter hibisci]MBI1683156.1 YbaN family protein [Caulobacter hibisci]
MSTPPSAELPSAEIDAAGAPAASRGVRIGYLIAGFAFTALGIVGAFLPLLPTTVFLILAAGCFGKSSPRLEAWLLNHPKFGPSVRAWRANKAIPRKAKIAACLGMAGGMAVFLLAARPKLWLGLLVGVIMASCAAFVVSRPEPPTV